MRNGCTRQTFRPVTPARRRALSPQKMVSPLVKSGACPLHRKDKRVRRANHVLDHLRAEDGGAASPPAMTFDVLTEVLFGLLPMGLRWAIYGVMLTIIVSAVVVFLL